MEDQVCRHGRPECTCLDDEYQKAVDAASQAGALTIWTTVSSGNDTVTSVSQRLTAGACLGYNTNDLTAAFGGTYSGGSCIPNTVNGQTITFPASQTNDFGFQFPEPSSTPITLTQCQQHGHEISDESIQLQGDEIWGECQACAERILIPRIVGAFNFERAGQYVGRAMTLDCGEDENGAELLEELTLLEETVDREIARYNRTLKTIKLARTLAKKQLLDHAKTAIG